MCKWRKAADKNEPFDGEPRDGDNMLGVKRYTSRVIAKNDTYSVYKLSMHRFGYEESASTANNADSGKA